MSQIYLTQMLLVSKPQICLIYFPITGDLDKNRMRITPEELKIIMIIYEDLKLRSYPTRMQLLGQMDKNR